MIKCPGIEVIMVSKDRYSLHVLLDGAILRVHGLVVCMCECVYVYGCISWCVLVYVSTYCMYAYEHMCVCIVGGRER